MLDHLSIAVSDLSRAIAFYDAVLAPLGYVRVWTGGDAAGYARPGETDEPFALKEQREPVATNERFHVAFKAPSNEAALAFYVTAMALAATDSGGVGLHTEYGSKYYAAFVVDLDGNRIEAVHHG
jgi:catechol 2,3-dioxygenase-like lactoylglutathione lyase family enzyme